MNTAPHLPIPRGTRGGAEGSDFHSTAGRSILRLITFEILHRDEEMSEIGITESMLKQALKEALVEVLEERRDILRDVIEEVLGDFELIEDIREVKKSDRMRRSIFSINEGEA